MSYLPFAFRNHYPVPLRLFIKAWIRRERKGQGQGEWEWWTEHAILEKRGNISRMDGKMGQLAINVREVEKCDKNQYLIF